MSNYLAKCISTKCPKYSDCFRAVSKSSAEMLYWIYCQPDGDYSYENYEWFIQREVSVNYSDSTTEDKRSDDLIDEVSDCMVSEESAL